MILFKFEDTKKKFLQGGCLAKRDPKVIIGSFHRVGWMAFISFYFN